MAGDETAREHAGAAWTAGNDRPAGLGDLIRLVHQTGLAPALWPETIRRIRTYFGAGGAMLVVRENRTNRHVLFSDDFSDESLSGDWWRAYNGRFHEIDTFARGAAGLRTGEVVGESVLIRRAGAEHTHYRSEFYGDFLKPFGAERLMTGIIANAGGSLGSLRLYRRGSVEPFSLAHRDEMARLAAHVSQACRVAVLLASMLDGDTAADLAIEACPRGIMFVDARGVTVYSNPAAAAILGSDDGLTLREGRLAARNAVSDRLLESALYNAVMTAAGAAAPPGGVAHIPRASGQPAYQVRVAPVIAHTESWLPFGLFDEEPVSAIALISDPAGHHRPPDEVIQALRYISRAGANLTDRLSAPPNMVSAAPVTITPGGAAPGRTTPGRTTPGRTTPGGTIAGGTTPGGAIPDRRGPASASGSPSGSAPAPGDDASRSMATWNRLRDLFADGDVRLQSTLVQMLDEAADSAPPESPDPEPAAGEEAARGEAAPDDDRPRTRLRLVPD